MTTPGTTTPRTLRISAQDLRARLDSGTPVTVLDVRSQKAWENSNEKLPGAVRVAPEQFQVNASWPKDRLTVAY
jgi:hypothetical protein